MGGAHYPGHRLGTYLTNDVKHGWSIVLNVQNLTRYVAIGEEHGSIDVGCGLGSQKYSDSNCLNLLTAALHRGLSKNKGGEFGIFCKISSHLSSKVACGDAVSEYLVVPFQTQEPWSIPSVRIIHRVAVIVF